MVGDKLTVGSAEVYPILDATLVNDGPGFWAWVPPDAKDKYPQVLGTGAKLRHDVTLYLVVL